MAAAKVTEVTASKMAAAEVASEMATAEMGRVAAAMASAVTTMSTAVAATGAGELRHGNNGHQGDRCHQQHALHD
jgi:hypothetical protein